MPHSILRTEETRLLTLFEEAHTAAHDRPDLVVWVRAIEARLRAVTIARALYTDLRADKSRTRQACWNARR